MRRFRYTLARWLAPDVFERHMLHVRVKTDVAQAIADLETLRREIERTAVLADARGVKCDLTLTLRTEMGRRP